MPENIRTMPLHRSRSGLACLYECGGGLTNTGGAQLVTSPTGKPKRAIHIRTHGNLCNDDHALIPVNVGDCVVSVDRHWDRVSIQVERIVAIKGDTATIERTDDLICWDAIQAAVEKSWDYHCRQPHYIQQLFEAQPTAQAEDDIMEDIGELVVFEEDEVNEI